MAYIHTLDDWKEIEATHKAVCDEPREEQKWLCADGPLGPQG